MRALWSLLFAGLVLVVCRDASAYPWMIRHEYTGCATCHADPSGGGLLTPYGRAQSEILLRTYYGSEKPEDRDPGALGDFAFGAMTLPKQLLLQGDIRGLLLHAVPESGPSDSRLVHMQSDLAAQLTLDRFRANVSLGYMHKGAAPAWLLGGKEDHHLVSRHHWLGLDLGAENQFLLRLGRMNLPYGLRSIEHTMWVRSATRSDINAAQQHGVALAYGGEKVRAELMAIAGSFQVSPDVFRDRGYAGYFEWAPTPRLAVGVSSLATHVDRDIQVGAGLFRQAHGLFGRYSPKKVLVISAEADALGEHEAGKPGRVGMAAMVSADVEPTQGLHLLTTAEIKDTSFRDQGASLGLWGGAAWFFAPHADLRADIVWRSEAVGANRQSSLALLGQLHFFL